MDKTGKIKVFNKACEKIWGINANEVLGDYIAHYYESETYAREINNLLKKSPNGRIHEYATRIKDRNGEIIPTILSASIFFDEQGKSIGSIGIFKDLRETLKLQEEKLQAEKLATLGKLAQTVGHEIKHDIATALNYIDVLAYECTDAEISKIYQYIRESLVEVVDKFQNMLTIGKPRTSKKTLIGADDVFYKVEEQMRHSAELSKIDFSANYLKDGCLLYADIGQLRQVLLNLFDNSIDAIKKKKYGEAISENGRIELSAETSNSELKITWKDNGCGISPRNISNIFTPFFTDKPTGNGLGLFIVKSIIENHNGNISVESTEGTGTCFEIIIPSFQNEVKN